MEDVGYIIQISIPTGTIKRKKLLAEHPEINEFQFLLVRLKETGVEKESRKGWISIPTGTIKRIINSENRFGN